MLYFSFKQNVRDDKHILMKKNKLKNIPFFVHVNLIIRAERKTDRK